MRLAARLLNMVLVILKITLFIRRFDAEVRATNATAKTPSNIELWIGGKRYGYMDTSGIALDVDPAIADGEPTTADHVVAFNWMEKITAFLLIRHYLKRDVRGAMRGIMRLTNS